VLTKSKLVALELGFLLYFSTKSVLRSVHC
jgi:hypothetical protein